MGSYDQYRTQYSIAWIMRVINSVYPLIQQQDYKHVQYIYQIIKILNKMKYFTVSLLIMAILFVCVTNTAIKTTHKRHFLSSSNGTRTDNLYLRCPIPRQIFYSIQRNQSKSAGRKQINNTIKLDGDTLIYSLLTKNQTGVDEQINKNKGNIVLYVIFLVLGLIATIVLVPILLFCCCKPNKCPPCLKIRQPEGKNYSKCQLKWPAIGIIILALIAIGTMIAVFVINPALQKGYSQTRCSVSMLFDDLLNGNYTKDGKSYFLGLKPLQGKINQLNNSLRSFFSGGSNVLQGGKAFESILNQIKNIKHDVKNISDQDYGQFQEYQSQKFLNNSQIGITHVQSQTYLHQFSALKQSSASLIGESHELLTKAQHKIVSLQQVLNLIDQAISNLTQKADEMINKYAKMVSMVQQRDKQTDEQLTTIQNKAITPLSVVIYIVAGLVIVTSVTIIIATFFICWFDKFDCRKVMYGACGALTSLGILCFVLSLLLSAVTVTSHYGCNYIETAIQNHQQFKYKFSPIFNNQLLTQIVAYCASKDTDGDLMKGITDGNLLRNFKISHQHIYSISQSDSQQLVSYLQSAKNSIHQTVQLYHNAQIIDVSSPSDIETFNKLSDAKFYQCSSPGFSSDSWVPSTSQSNVHVACKVQSRVRVTDKTCPSISQFQARNQQGCIGCIDSSRIFGYFSNKQQILQSLNKRYSSPDCAEFNKQLANSWQKFYSKKIQQLKPIQQKAKQTQHNIEALQLDIKQNFSVKLTNTINHLQTNINTLIDPTNQQDTLPTQILPTSQSNSTRVDCKVIGEDVQLITQTFCTQIFNYSFSMRVLMIIGGFCLLGIIILATFLGIRSYRSTQIQYQSNNKYSVQQNSGGRALQNQIS